MSDVDAVASLEDEDDNDFLEFLDPPPNRRDILLAKDTIHRQNDSYS
jgi:hypothetical protein